MQLDQSENRQVRSRTAVTRPGDFNSCHFQITTYDKQTRGQTRPFYAPRFGKNSTNLNKTPVQYRREQFLSDPTLVPQSGWPHPVLSKSNTKPEMKRKLGEYFAAGVKLVWMVDPKQRTVRVHTAVDQSVLIKKGQPLDGGAVLPGFVLRLDELFPDDQPSEQ